MMLDKQILSEVIRKKSKASPPAGDRTLDP
jgi:hypothetical protein